MSTGVIMAEEATENPEVEEAPKKKKNILLIVVIALSTILVIIAVVFATLFLSGFFEHKSEAAANEKVDQLEKDAESAKEEPAEPEKIKKDADAPRFENTYMQIDKEFMTNITNSKKVMVVQIALMTHYDERVFDNVKKHEFAIRSAVLDVMRQSTEEDTRKPEFRTELAEKVKDTINQVLIKYEDFGGIEEVFFTSFVMQ
jgi:flagellar protein FliL